MKRNIIETVFGGVVLLVAGFFVVFSYSTANISNVNGYEVTAQFSTTGGLKEGADVSLSGVKIGTVTDIALNTQTYFAEVRMSIDPQIQLPTDTAATIASESLLGGRFLSLEPGAADEYLAAGDRILSTQAPVNLEQLLSRFIFSGNGQNDQNASTSTQGDDAL